jgi:hypothetical protein
MIVTHLFNQSISREMKENKSAERLTDNNGRRFSKINQPNKKRPTTLRSGSLSPYFSVLANWLFTARLEKGDKEVRGKPTKKSPIDDIFD